MKEHQTQHALHRLQLALMMNVSLTTLCSWPPHHGLSNRERVVRFSLAHVIVRKILETHDDYDDFVLKPLGEEKSKSD